MYFFKNTAGNWIIGPELTSFRSKVASELIIHTPTNVSVRTIEKKVYLVERTEVTEIKKNVEGDFYANYAEFLTAVSDFFDNAPITAEEVDAKIGAEVDTLSDRIDTVEGIANAASSGSLGSIKPTDAAPTPARNGNYTFSIGGNKPAWLTAEAGITEVKAGDGVAVVYDGISAYTYTHVDVSSAFVTMQKLSELGYMFKGVATPTTVPGTPDGNVFYIATTPGTYTNFGGYIHSGNNMVIFSRSGGGWIHTLTNVSTIGRFDYISSEVIVDSANIVRPVIGWYSMSGVLTMQSAWYSTNKTQIVDNVIYFYCTYQSNVDVASICFWDASQNFISALRVLRTGYYLLQAEIPSNAVYFTASISNVPNAVVKTGGAKQLKTYIDDSIAFQKTGLMPFSDYAPAFTAGKYYNCNTGVLVTQSGWNYTALVSCVNKSILFSGLYVDNNSVASVIFFDENSVFIAKASLTNGISYTNELLVQPAGAAYVAFSKSDADTTTYKIADNALLYSALAKLTVEVQSNANAKYKNQIFNYFGDYNLISLKKYVTDYDWTGVGLDLSITETSLFSSYGFNREMSLTNSGGSSANKVIYGIGASDIRQNLKNTKRIHFRCYLLSTSTTSFTIQLYRRDTAFASVKTLSVSLTANVIKEAYFYYDFPANYDFSTLQYLQYFVTSLGGGITIKMSPFEIWDGTTEKEIFQNKVSRKEINIFRDNSGFVDKNILYIGDSISTNDNFFWKGYLETYFGLKYLRENTSITFKPAAGGKVLYPPVSEIAGNESMWYLCGSQRLVGYAPDKIFLFGGTNDLNAGYNLGASTDTPYIDTDSRPGSLTWSSALKGCIVMLQRDFPGIEIVICTVLDTTGYGTAMYNANFTVKEKMARLQMEIAALYSLKCVPLFWSSGITAANCAVFSADQVHPNKAGARRMANCVAETLFLR